MNKQPVFTAQGDASADIVIVGSGVVGGMIANELVSQGYSVLVLEAGLRIERSQAVENWRNMPFANRAGSDFQGLYPQSKFAPAPLYFPPNNYVNVTGPNASSFQQGYLRTVGGTTWHWAASCWRHDPSDFVMQSKYGVGRDWPISYDELEPWYCKAENEIGVAGPHDPARQSPSQRSQPYPMDMVPFAHGDSYFASVVNPHGYNLVPIPQGRSTRPWEGRPTCCGNNNCQPICPIGAMYNGIHHIERAERAGAVVLAEAVVYKMDTDSNNRITAVHWKDSAGASHKASGKAFALACNGIETPRLLLMAANEANPTGIANSSDMVGRNMMDHSGFHCSFLTKEPVWLGRGPAQSSCMVGYRDGEFRRDYSANKVILNNISRVVAATTQALAKGLVGKALDEEIRYRAVHSVDLSISLEPLPDPENRLTLSKTRLDPHGLPCPDIYYDVGDYVRKGAEASHAQLEHIGQLFDAKEFNISKGLNANNHIMGGVIMGKDAKDAVVDGNCRAFDHENLWLPGGGAIPSASVVNSTLTMAALALKAAQDMAMRMKGAGMKKLTLLSLLLASVTAASFAASAEELDVNLLHKGQQVASASDCQACHTAPGSKSAFSGGYAIASPMGVIYSTNITPAENGIGQYTEAQFSAAVRDGVRADGAQLYPAMPYTSYSQMTDEDLHALYYYFEHGVKPVDRANQQTSLPFPFSLRFSMKFWNLMFANTKRFEPDSSKSAEWNRGNYLVNSLAHCNTCHTPRGVLMQEESAKPLAGGPLGSWYAPNITSDKVSGIGGWSDQELMQYLKTGRAEGKNQAAGGMAEAVENSLQYLPDSDLKAIAVYLKSTPAIRDDGDTQAAFSYGKPMDVENSIRGRNPNNANHSLTTGAALFSGNCASCHQPDGAGSKNQAYPSLFHNTATGLRDPNNLISAILFGVQRKTADGDVLMPGFSSPSYVDKLNDQQVADITNFVRQNYGNPEGTVTAGDVAWVRKGGHPPLLAEVQPWIVPGSIAVIVIVLIIVLLWRRARRK